MPSDELHAWEPHPEYENTEIRRDGSEQIVLSLQPEGIAPSQCWAWTVHTASNLPWRHGVNMGSDLDRDVARAQADAAAVSYGYRIIAPDTWAETARRDAPSVARHIRNLSVTDAAPHRPGGRDHLPHRTRERSPPHHP